MPLLREAGITAIAIDLPGHGDDGGPFTDLHGDAARVLATLDSIDGEIVLLGHSYGGAVITEAGVHPSVTHLVYLCALVLDQDETCQVAAVDASSPFPHEERPNLAEGMIIDDEGRCILSSASAAACLYNQCDVETVNWALARIGPHPMENLGQTPSAVAWRDRPSTYITCADDRAIPPGLQRRMSKRCTHSYEWPTGHSPFASHPSMLSDVLVKLATAISG